MEVIFKNIVSILDSVKIAESGLLFFIPLSTHLVQYQEQMVF